MIIVDGDKINNLQEAALWLKEAWIYEPYDIYYEEFGEKNTPSYTECICIEPTRDNYESDGWVISSLDSFKRFIGE